LAKGIGEALLATGGGCLVRHFPRWRREKQREIRELNRTMTSISVSALIEEGLRGLPGRRFPARRAARPAVEG
jgi:hypothetical protein